MHVNLIKSVNSKLGNVINSFVVTVVERCNVVSKSSNKYVSRYGFFLRIIGLAINNVTHGILLIRIPTSSLLSKGWKEKGSRKYFASTSTAAHYYDIKKLTEDYSLIALNYTKDVLVVKAVLKEQFR